MVGVLFSLDLVVKLGVSADAAFPLPVGDMYQSLASCWAQPLVEATLWSRETAASADCATRFQSSLTERSWVENGNVQYRCSVANRRGCVLARGPRHTPTNSGRREDAQRAPLQSSSPRRCCYLSSTPQCVTASVPAHPSISLFRFFSLVTFSPQPGAPAAPPQCRPQRRDPVAPPYRRRRGLGVLG